MTHCKTYKVWRNKVVELVTAQNVPDRILDLVTEPMLKDAFKKHEFPEYFVKTIWELS